MKKLLIIAYDFPPYVSVGGLRPFSWYKLLHRFDIYPIVVTRQWENRFGNQLDYIAPGYSDETQREETEFGVIIKAPFQPNLANRLLLKYGADKFKLPRRLITSFYEFLQFVFLIGNKRTVYFAADEFLKNNKVDCIIATGDPFVLFKYADRLSRKYSIPWIADYRDAWIQDKTTKSAIYRKWCAFFERRILKSAEKAITVSSFMEKQIKTNVRETDFEIVYNGFDPEILKVTEGIEQTGGALSIAFAGTIYDSHPIESVLRVCNEILTENPDARLELNFYGINKEKDIRDLLATKYRELEKHAEVHPRMENLELAKTLARHNAFLLFNDYSIIGSKIFDYLAVKRKILFCYEDDSEAKALKKDFYWLDEIETESSQLQAEMINATNSGIVLKDSKHLKETLLQMMKEVDEKGFIACSPVGVEQFSRTEQTELLAEIVKAASAKRELKD